MNELVKILLIPFLLAWKGYVLTILWRWFIVPVFGAPALTVAPAIGVLAVVGLLTYQARKGEADWNAAEYFLLGTLNPALALFGGWVVTWFMR